ncbi:MAG TPA: MFS transporter, partial [Planctomycetota bacterium]|nr:MFS transporter [Planctomycetota bacterium]
LLGAAGGLGVVLGTAFGVVVAAACVGMVNGMGRDRGGSLVIDQAILPATAGAAQRTGAFARYNVLQDAGHAVGGLLAALPALLRRSFEIDELASLRTALCVYSALMLMTAPLYAWLSTGVETSTAVRQRVSAASRRVLWRISSLFALDSLAGGFLTTALLVFFFFERFGVGEAEAAGLFFAARVLNAGSHLAAAWLSRRIGLLNTMVFTHIPSSLLLASVAFAPSFEVAALLFLLREGLVEMDVPTRQSYVMAVVRPEERMFASGVTHLVRLGAWAAGPVVAGLLMSGGSLATPLFVGAAMKIVYDVLLGITFRRVRPPEER